MTRRKLLIICPFIHQRGGAELLMIHAMEQAQSVNLQIALALPAEGEISDRAHQLGVPTAYFGTARMRRIGSYVKSVWALAKFSKSFGAELILSWDAHQLYRAAAVGMVGGIPSAWYQQGGLNPHHWLSALHLRIPTRAVLANSLHTAREQKEAMDRIGYCRPIYLVPPAVNLDEFNLLRVGNSQACRAKLNLPQSGPLIALVGRLQAWKGFHVLIAAMVLVRREFPTAKAVLVGGEHATEPEYPAGLRKQAIELGVIDSVIFTGQVAHEEIASYMQAADVIVHASSCEPFGIVVIEAMALGKPLVAASTGGPPTVVEDGVDGLLASPNEPSAIARQICRILKDPASARTMGERAAKKAEAFSTEQFGLRLANAVDQIVRRTSAEGIICDSQLQGRTIQMPRTVL